MHIFFAEQVDAVEMVPATLLAVIVEMVAGVQGIILQWPL